MKKIVIFFSLFLASYCSFGQFIINPGMENWRTGTAGSILTGGVVAIAAPYAWNGIDSLIITDGELLTFASGFTRQVFEENTIVHSGSHSAKIMTTKEDTLGIVPGMLTNQTINVNLGASSLANAISFDGGFPDTLRVNTVSAWFVYKPGKDSAGLPSLDSGSMVIEAIANYYGVDSIVGIGTVLIPPTDTFIQLTATMVYNDTLDAMDSVRITFSSSGGANATDSSILYVDDITSTGVPQPTLAIRRMNAKVDQVQIYPNPANDKLITSGDYSQVLNLTIFNVNGAVILSRPISGKTETDVAAFAEGLYFYTISNDNGVIQRGKLSIVH